MTYLSRQITQEILELVGHTDKNFDRLKFEGVPVAHNLKFPIDEIAAGVHGSIGLLIENIWKLRTGQSQDCTIDIFHAYLSLSSVLFLKQNGYVLSPWDPKYPTVGIYDTKDSRRIYLHGGHPSLRDKILKVLEAPNEASYIADSVKRWDAQELEDAISAVGGTAVVVRTAPEWAAHPQGAELEKKPVLALKLGSQMTPQAFSDNPTRPLSDIRVLDLTHVLAAPMASRVLAEYGADVLHITSPHVADTPNFVIDTSHGKRQAYLNLKDPKDLDRFKALLAEADVLVEGWRPGFMDDLGLSPELIQIIRPGLIHMRLNCYGDSGPYVNRGGWEQIGQAASGIVESNSYPRFDAEGNLVGKLSLDTIQTHGLAICDYLSGFLGAAGILSALIKRSQTGGGYYIPMSLTRCAMWALSKSSTEHTERRPLQLPLSRPEYEQYLKRSEGPYGVLEYLALAVNLSNTPPVLENPCLPLGSGTPEWIVR
jgi:crotonobetainyl-CoA:carnitine CoA-transferase CaiB-like acyl-CoA transferase